MGGCAVLGVRFGCCLGGSRLRLRRMTVENLTDGGSENAAFVLVNNSITLEHPATRCWTRGDQPSLATGQTDIELRRLALVESRYRNTRGQAIRERLDFRGVGHNHRPCSSGIRIGHNNCGLIGSSDTPGPERVLAATRQKNNDRKTRVDP